MSINVGDTITFTANDGLTYTGTVFERHYPSCVPATALCADGMVRWIASF